MTAMRECRRCHEVKPLEKFCKDKNRECGRSNLCSSCKNIANAISAKRPAHKRNQALWFRRNNIGERRDAANKRRSANRKKYVRDTSKEAARRAFALAVRNGSLERPDSCSECGIQCIPHGHHEDYSKPLDVQWLCVGCHARKHRKYKEEE